MCNGYPALRCSRHAKDLLIKAQIKLDTAKTIQEIESAEKQLDTAEKIFYTTPAGFKFLEEKIETTESMLEKDHLYGLLRDGQTHRRKSKILYKRIHRKNAETIEHAELLKLKGLPWWTIACQLGVDFLEKTENITLINSKELPKNGEKNNYYTINVKEKNFMVAIDDKKYLVINNKHYFNIYEKYFKDETVTGVEKVLDISRKYSDRGNNTEIFFEELTRGQQELLISYIKEYFSQQGITNIVVTDPKIGLTENYTIDNINQGFIPTLFTELELRNGTDYVTDSVIDKFDTSNTQLWASEVIKVQDKYLIESVEQLAHEDKINGNYILIPLKENIYEIKKRGNIRGIINRVLLTFTFVEGTA